MRSASSPAGIANRMNGGVSPVCNRPVWPSPTPSSSTATIGAAASAICSADCAARLDQASRLKVAGKELGMDASCALIRNMEARVVPTHPIPDEDFLIEGEIIEEPESVSFPEWTALQCAYPRLGLLVARRTLLPRKPVRIALMPNATGKILRIVASEANSKPRL